MEFLVITLGVLFIPLGKSMNKIDSDEFEKMIDGDNVFVINTHTPYMGEIVGTDLIAENWQNMKTYSELLPIDKDVKIIVYCRSGRMADVAAEQLEKMGYSNVYNLEVE